MIFFSQDNRRRESERERDRKIETCSRSFAYQLLLMIFIFYIQSVWSLMFVLTAKKSQGEYCCASFSKTQKPHKIRSNIRYWAEKPSFNSVQLIISFIKKKNVVRRHRAWQSTFPMMLKEDICVCVRACVRLLLCYISVLRTDTTHSLSQPWKRKTSFTDEMRMKE